MGNLRSGELHLAGPLATHLTLFILSQRHELIAHQLRVIVQRLLGQHVDPGAFLRHMCQCLLQFVAVSVAALT